MPNYSDRTTDKELATLEKRIAKMYQQASEELNEKWDHYVNGWDEEIDGKIVHHKGVAERYEQEYKAYQQGKYTKEEFDEWYKAQIGRGERWETMRDQMTDRMMKANETACSYVNDKTPGIYTLNHNYSLYQIESVHPNVSFTLADENTVKRLVSQKNHVNFRVLKMDRKRDYKWNKTKINNALAQGILQGENPRKIAKRFMGVMESNHAAAVRNARTAFTSAQNGGRIDSYQKASKMGIEIQKEWLATSDSRTRPSHVEANGQRQPWDKPFQMGHGTLKYPGDPAGYPAEVYNCRCTVVPVLPKVEKNSPGYDEWMQDHKNEKLTGIKLQKLESTSNNGYNNGNSDLKMNLKFFAKTPNDFEAIRLPYAEYMMVKSAFNTYIYGGADRSREKRKIISKEIRNFRYTVINHEFDIYTIIEKEPLE